MTHFKKILADCIFDLVFEPDFLESVMYEALVAIIRDHVSLRDKEERNQAYAQGVEKGFLFPIRSRILKESVTLPDGSTLASGSYVYFNLKKSRIISFRWATPLCRPSLFLLFQRTFFQPPSVH